MDSGVFSDKDKCDICNLVADFFELPSNVPIFLEKSNPRMNGCCFKNPETGKIEITLTNIYERPLISVIETLCHEIVHAKQMLDNRLIILYDRKQAIFGGKIYDLVTVKSSKENLGDYKSQPWEAEAYAHQLKMTELFAEYIRVVDASLLERLRKDFEAYL